MDKIWYHIAIKYLQEKGLAVINLNADIVITLRNNAPGLSTIHTWAAEFRREREKYFLFLLLTVFFRSGVEILFGSGFGDKRHQQSEF